MKETLAARLPAFAVAPVGGPGTEGAAGVTTFDAVDAGLVPAAFFATTVNVYGTPFASPSTIAVVTGAVTVATKVPGDDVTT